MLHIKCCLGLGADTDAIGQFCTIATMKNFFILQLCPLYFCTSLFLQKKKWEHVRSISAHNLGLICFSVCSCSPLPSSPIWHFHRGRKETIAPLTTESSTVHSAKHKRLIRVKPQIPLHYFLQDLITFVQLAPLWPILGPVEKDNPFWNVPKE